MHRMRILILIIGMGIVTYIPRMLPAVLIGKVKFNKNIEKFLSLIPYTAMAALIFPGVLSVDEGNLSIGLIGAFVAIILSWIKMPIILVVIGAIVADMAVYMIM
ncbi:MAG TPA: AzlD domain-containing protein [Clostridiales bacterium]|nr:AzlD domain-containing protein [Clostridiales bacterium]